MQASFPCAVVIGAVPDISNPVWPIIISLVLLGSALLVAEVFIPGMIVGIAGLTSLIVATVLCYMYVGTGAGHLLLAAELAGGVGFFVWWFRYVPWSPWARRWTLHAEVSGQSQDLPAPLAADAVGTALTQLRPSGVALIDGQRMSVVTDGELVEAGRSVKVQKVEGMRIVVRAA